MPLKELCYRHRVFKNCIVELHTGQVLTGNEADKLKIYAYHYLPHVRNGWISFSFGISGPAIERKEISQGYTQKRRHGANCGDVS